MNKEDLLQPCTKTVGVPQHNMGVGPIGLSTTQFVRQFRFLLYFTHMEPDFIHSVDIDWTNHRAKFKVYEAVVNGKIAIHEWVENMKKIQYPGEMMHFVTLDGCGYELYRKEFNGLDIVSTGSSFNYGVSDVVLYEVEVSYWSCKDIPASGRHQNPAPVDEKETGVHHLNETIYIRE